MSQQEICRHFLRGSCRFGARCRYSHAIPNQNQNQNQSKPSNNPFGFGSSQFSQQQQQQKPNPFGFGSAQFSQQQQQQKPNPFGFGVQNKNSTAQFQSPSKPFDNKWTRQTSSGSKQADPQSQASVHTCTDSESCKQIIAEDFKSEAPQWKLTCYAHYKHLPCDVHGDISPEELRALAYDEAKQDRSLQSIVERERNLLQSKLSEFENLLRTPYIPPNGNMNPTSSQSNTTPTFTGFNQMGAASNSSSPFRSPGASSAPNNIFGQAGYNHAPSNTSNNIFGQPSFSQNNNMTMQPSFGRQLPNENQASAANFSFGKNINANANTTGSQLFSSLSAHLNPSSSNNNPSNNKQQQQLASLSLGFTTAAPPPSEEKQEEDSMDDSIWLKEKWAIGEIPERPPPLRFCT